MKRFLLTFLTLVFSTVLFLPAAWATLAVDNTSVLDQNANADPWTFAHTTSASANLLLVGCIASSNTDPGGVGMTYDSVSADAIDINLTQSGGGDAFIIFVAHWVNPNAGTDLTVSVDWTNADFMDGGCIARSYSGADGTTPVSGAVTDGSFLATPTETSSSISVSCESGGQAVDFIGREGTEAITVGADQTEIVQQDDGLDLNVFSSEDGAATNTMSWSWTTAANFAHGGVCVNSGATTRRRPIPTVFMP